MVFGFNVKKSNEEPLVKSINFDSYHVTEISNYKQDIYKESTNYDNIESEETINPLEPTQPMDGPMDSAWPMYCHDTHHTGRSPYSTAGNVGFNKWWFKTDYGFIEGSGVIDKDGVITDYRLISYDLMYLLLLSAT